MHFIFRENNYTIWLYLDLNYFYVTFKIDIRGNIKIELSFTFSGQHYYAENEIFSFMIKQTNTSTKM